MIHTNQEMEDINNKINEAYNYFNTIPPNEYDLIDIAIYTINALESQRNYIIKQYKKN